MAGAKRIQLVSGLGNPGTKYLATRHNAGFWFVNLLANKFHAEFRSDTKFSAEVASFEYEQARVWLLKPMTFMNLSGESIAPFAKYYQIAPENILVVHDEIDLPAGTARYKKGGGHGGHNGLRDIIKHFSKEFWRLRIGVGHPGSKEQVISYVTRPPGDDELQLIHSSINAALDTVANVLTGDIDAAMRQLHQKSD